MALPSWIAEQQKRVDAIKATRVAPIYMRPPADSPLNAPGWKELSIKYTCVPDAAYPWDPAIVKAIQVFDPGFAPIWVRWTFLSPDNTEIVTFGRHAFGRYRELQKDVPTLRIEAMPLNAFFKKPNIIEKVWMGQSDSDLPGPYQPFDATLYNFCRRNYCVKSSREMIADMHAEIERDKLKKINNEIELEYRQRELDKYTSKKLAQMSEVEMKEVFGKLQHRKHEAKPFIQMGSTPKR